MKLYRLTSNQINEAIKYGIITDYKYVRNPYYSNAPQSLLINEDEVKEKAEEIRKLPKYSLKEMESRKRAMKKYRFKKKYLSFYCPRCKRTIIPLRGSTAVESSFNDEMDLEKAKKLLIIAHYRHEHTTYEIDRLDVESWLEGEDLEEWNNLIDYYEKEKDNMDRDTREIYIEEIRYLKAKAYAEAKKYYTRKAVELAKQDGLL